MATYPQEGVAKNTRLDSWKEIAAFFGRDARTVKRWESERALPVHRVPGGERGGVFAYVHELELWLNASQSKRDLALPPATDEQATDRQVNLAAPNLLVPEQSIVGDHLQSNNSQLLQPSRIVRIGAWASAGILLTVFAAGLVFHLRRSQLAATAVASETRAARTGNHAPDPAAADLYLKGRYYWNLRTSSSLNQAMDYFTQSIVHDPQYAPAYAGLADCYLLLREYARMPDNEAFPRAVAAARKAVELDPSSSEAHRSLAFAMHYWDWDLPLAEQEFRRALQLNPNDAEAHHWYATSMLAAGRYGEALAQIDEARRLQPASISILADRDVILLLAGRQQEAVASLRQLEAADSGFLSPHVYLASAYLLAHDDRNYLDELKKAATISKDKYLLAAANSGHRALVRGGEPAMFTALAQQIGELADRGQESPYRAATLYALAGDKRRALSYLAASFARRESSFLSARLDANFGSLRQDPGFQALIARVATSTRHD